MVGDSPVLAIFYALGLAIVGCAIGAIEAWLLGVARKTSVRRVWKAAVLGACGMVGGFVLTALLPWPQNTITYKVGETVITSTTNTYQHPYYVAFALAVTLPLLHIVLNRKESVTR